MGDIRYRLNERRKQLLPSIEADRLKVSEGGFPGAALEVAKARIDELASIEATLATMQLADAQREVAAAQREIAEAQRTANEADADKRSVSEERAFWSRRLVTSMTVANAAGVVAVLAFMTKTDSPVIPLRDVQIVLTLFSTGLLAGGFYPALKIVMAKDAGKPKPPFDKFIEWFYPALMAACLCGAIFITQTAAAQAYTRHLKAKGATAADLYLPPVPPSRFGVPTNAQ